MASWEQVARAPALPRDEVHLWRISLADAPARCPDLCEEERMRATRMASSRARLAFTTGRQVLRALLGRYQGADPRSLPLRLGPHGKPSLEGSDLEFNLSHSGDWALLAFARGRLLGVDVERTDRAHDLDRLARRVFSRREAELYFALPRHDRRCAFFLAWTRKEAFVKAHGRGIGLGLERFDVELRPGLPAALLATRIGGDSTRRWRLAQVPSLDAGHAAALCFETPFAAGEPRLRFLDFTV